MTFFIVALISIVLGTALVGVSLFFVHRGEADKISKPLSELFMKSAVVVFGGFIAFVAFFGQKWLEDTNRRIDDANEALANLDIIQSEYMSAVESTYYNDDPDFIEIYEKCRAELEILSKDDGYCEANLGIKTVSNQTLLDGIYYLDFSPPETVIDGFSQKLYSQSFIKKTILSSTMKEIFAAHSTVQERYGVIVDDIKNVRDQGARIRSQINTSTKEKNNPPTKISLQQFAHSMCCAVIDIHNNSDIIRAQATALGRNFCSIRRQVRDEIRKSTDPAISFLANSRLSDIDQYVDRYFDKQGARKESCDFIPAKPRTAVAERLEAPTEPIGTK